MSIPGLTEPLLPGVARLLQALLEKYFVSGTTLGVLGRRAAEEARTVGKAMKAYVDSYSNPQSFEADWIWLRLAVPLQVRLMVEQVLWNKRGGWRDLVTGFGPVKGRKRAIERSSE